METKVIKLRDFKPENMRFSSLRTTKHGGKIVYINYDYEDGRQPKPLRIQLPKMKAPFGIAGWDAAKIDKKDSSPTEGSNDTLELSLGNDAALIEIFDKMDQVIVEEATRNSKEYFKKKYAEDYIKMQYKSSVKFNENEDGERDFKYPPRLKTKMYKDSSFAYRTQVFNSDKQPVPMDVYNQSEVIPKGAECVALLECGGIWVISDKFGVSWRPAQMKVYKTDNKLSGYSFIDEDQDEESEKDHEENVCEDNDDVEEESKDSHVVPEENDPLESGVENLNIGDQASVVASVPQKQPRKSKK